MDKIIKQFDDFCIDKRSTMFTNSTYLLDMDVSKSQDGKRNMFVGIFCSDNSIKLYNHDTLTMIREYMGQSDLLSGVRFSHTSENLLFSACNDGTVKCWDIRISSSDAAQLFNGFPSNVFISFDVNCNDTLICAGTENLEDETALVFWDARMTTSLSDSKEPLGIYSDSHNDDITKVCFHPTTPNLLLSGSTDGLINVFDLNKDTEDDALVITCNSESSVSFIGWSGKVLNQIYCLTHDEGFCWWDIAQLDTEEPITLLKIQDTREAFKADHFSLDYLTGAFYNEKADSLFILGGSHTGALQLMSCQMDGFHHYCSLVGGHSSTLRTFFWNHETQSLLTGGEDAQLLLWKPKTVEMVSTGKSTMKMPSSIRQRVRIHSNPLQKTKKKKELNA